VPPAMVTAALGSHHRVSSALDCWQQRPHWTGGRMPLPRTVANFNRRFFNRLTVKVAGHLPGFGVVQHLGRKSGHAYRTPINVFRRDGVYIIALTYGSQGDWVKNVLAAGRCELETRGRRVLLCRPRVVTDARQSWAPLPVQLVLRLTHTSQYMHLEECEALGSILRNRPARS
jgi:deazaflavin-dependent oxidoreductase (nitroreductase family)